MCRKGRSTFISLTAVECVRWTHGIKIERNNLLCEQAPTEVFRSIFEWLVTLNILFVCPPGICYTIFNMTFVRGRTLMGIQQKGSNLTTLCYIEQGGRYLMLHRVKKENDINKDKWIGVGGHFEAGESPEECVLREVKEETGYTLTSYRFRGLITFVCGEEYEYICLYTADGFSGTPVECDEGTLEWVDMDRIEELNLWEGDKIFFRLLQENRPFFSLKLSYGDDGILREAILDGKPMKAGCDIELH